MEVHRRRWIGSEPLLDSRHSAGKPVVILMEQSKVFTARHAGGPIGLLDP